MAEYEKDHIQQLRDYVREILLGVNAGTDLTNVEALLTAIENSVDELEVFQENSYQALLVIQDRIQRDVWGLFPDNTITYEYYPVGVPDVLNNPTGNKNLKTSTYIQSGVPIFKVTFRYDGSDDIVEQKAEDI